ncbi:DUF742 domain-containing protein [Streptomyces sp. HNM0663]|uniref:DUF742 domain-containing protein n=1 Tax=Streptomyces chengmaiensis TaxID=3040919 RepID=A0ABT6HZI7_9ACTN|nr:DUF742 domain-containing protein [Streptomyces chengmaiensis]MDH2394133.1 DUF742 domain-containing protein [Streptomyces chengmaiensis]
MATPPGGRPYDGGHQASGEHPQSRFNFPSAPTGRGGGQDPYQQPQAPQSPYDRTFNRQARRPAEQPQQRAQQSAGGSGAAGARPSGAHNPLVRPYAMTGGRTRPRYQLAIEALVSTTADPARLQGQLPEHQRICRLCFEIKSVAEISALLSIPLGVARILVADLAEAGLVAIHQPGGEESAGGQPDVTLLERVLSGLRKL